MQITAMHDDDATCFMQFESVSATISMWPQHAAQQACSAFKLVNMVYLLACDRCVCKHSAAAAAFDSQWHHQREGRLQP